LIHPSCRSRRGPRRRSASASPPAARSLVTLDGDEWSLPGGTIEPGEALEQTLVREVREAACARVVESRHIGCQRVDELDGDGASYYQTRFWARVELDPPSASTR